jgi:hypothetical protein
VADNPLNLVLRFLLEIAGLTALGFWGWTQHEGPARWLWTVGAVVAAAAVWAVFRVPGDGGPPVVAVAGRPRLVVETAFFAAATAALLASGQRTAALVFAALVLAHYAVSYDRVMRLLETS